ARRPLRPLRFDHDVPTAVDVKILHDGARVAVRLSWRTSSARAAGAAVRLAGGPDPDFALCSTPTSPGWAARWRDGDGETPAAGGAPPQFVPLSTWTDLDPEFRADGVRRDGECAVVFTRALPAD